MKLGKLKSPRSPVLGFRGLEAADADVWSTGRWSPGSGLREVALHGESRAADDAGTRRHLDAGESRDGGVLDGGLAIDGHAERRALSRHRGNLVDHVGHLLRVLGADPATGRGAQSVTSWAERYRGAVVSAKRICGHFAKNFEKAHPTTSRRACPYRSSLAGPTPLMRRSAAADDGRCSAISCSVASVKTTNAGTLSSSARSLRQARRRSNRSSSYDAGQSAHRPRFFSAALDNGLPHSRQWAARRGVGRALRVRASTGSRPCRKREGW